MTNKKVEATTSATNNPASTAEKQVATTSATDSGKAKKVKTATTADGKVVEYETLSLKKLQLASCEIKDVEFNFKLSNVKDVKYFNRGIAYFNYASMLIQVESEQKKVDEKITGIMSEKDYESSSEYLKLKIRKDALADIHKEINDYKDHCKFTEEEVQEFKEDNFLKLTASSVCKVDVPLGGLKEVIEKLNVYKEAAYLQVMSKKAGTAFNELKAELQNMADMYNTDDGTRYKKSRLRVNCTMTSQLYQRLYRGCRLDKSGNFTASYNNDKVIRNEIIAQFTARLQGSIPNND